MMRFTARDGQILETIHAYDGVLPRRHIRQLFWPDRGWRVVHRRLANLHQNNYISKPSLENRKSKPIPEPIVWLDWRGVLHVAGQAGIKVEEPKSGNEHQLRALQSRLRKAGMRWLREPLWSQLVHDIFVVDIRLSFEKAGAHHPNLKIGEWINESVFRSQPDLVEYEDFGKSLSKKNKRGVVPDGAFLLSDLDRKEQGKPHKARFLLELDMATHDNPSFGLEKAAPGAAYIKSDAYRKRFGSNSGRWLVITTSNVRLKNLVRQIETTVRDDRGFFLLSTIDLVKAGDPMVDAIWLRPGVENSIRLLRD